MKIEPGFRPKRSDPGELSMRDLGDEFLAYDRAHQRVHVLNSTAREILALCDGTSTVEEIAVSLVDTYGIDLDTAMKDLTATIERLVQLGLVEAA